MYILWVVVWLDLVARVKTAMNRLKNKLPWPSRQRQSCSVCTNSLDFKWGDKLEWRPYCQSWRRLFLNILGVDFFCSVLPKGQQIRVAMIIQKTEKNNMRTHRSTFFIRFMEELRTPYILCQHHTPSLQRQK